MFLPLVAFNESDGYAVQISQLDLFLHLARLLVFLGSGDRITSALRQLQWLPVKFRVAYKLCLIMHAVHVGHCPDYIVDLVTQTSSLPGRDILLSAAGNRFELPAIYHKFG